MRGASTLVHNRWRAGGRASAHHLKWRLLLARHHNVP